MPRPIRLVRNIEASRLFDTFLVSSIATVLITRAYLSLTGYPQIGSSQLHIAHLLPGGLLMMTAILIMIGSINRSSRDVAAFLGGIGFGLFWDELGKFITQDNNYFFKPAVGIIYLSFVALYLITRYVIRRSYHSEDYLANAIDLAMDGAIGELDPREYADAKALLAKADPNHPMYSATVQLLEQAKPTKNYRPFIVDRLTAALHRPFHMLVQKSWFSRALLWTFYIYGAVAIAIFFVLGFNGTALTTIVLHPSKDTNTVAIFSSAVSVAVIVWGIWLVQIGKTLAALRKFETALLISIFVTQTALFFSYQLSAIVGLAFTLCLLVFVRMVMRETKE